MKKILVALLILAVVGGVFAQEGDWSIGGSVVVGTRLDFDPTPDVSFDDDPALVDGIGYWNWDGPRGALEIGYTRGIIGITTVISSKNGDQVFNVGFDGDNFRGQFRIDNLIGALTGTSGSAGVDRLWGEYKFFNGVVTLEASAYSAETEFWVSDKTGTFYGTTLAGTPAWDDDGYFLTPDGLGDDSRLITGWKTKHMFGHQQQTFTFVDHHNYLRVNAEISALNFGIMIPNLFIPTLAWDSWGNTPQGAELLAHALPYTVLGVTFAQSPLEIAAQFQMANYGIYFGGRVFFGPVTVGLSFTGVLDKYRTDNDTDYDPKQLKIGGRADYDGGQFGGGVKVFYSKDEEEDTTGKSYLSYFGVEPTFFYNAIPSHLKFALDVGFYFLTARDLGADTTDKSTVWAIQPQIFWNFLGTGAASMFDWSLNTGIAVRYRVAVADVRNIFGPTDPAFNLGANFLDVVFKLSF